ncbi:DUF429 domain-containing protein [Brevundimonas sp. PAMC22021]|uniref:DUF429 domain-containing protein n=1 Tax=Brevundimonas sp. PAMC22021 TaxID=2861285 RepID=UPI001C630922|nr:DUF429 domain-containing protein [Brevundimonas sp. PAMC22021]QYF87700.1 DUF429 domain-containing protein [Brevundimonas sp. PAMC22021]
MTKEVFIGFDSAWTDNPKQPGAIALMEFEDGKPSNFTPPTSATFAQASDAICDAKANSDYVLIALDQPTLVPNRGGCRPVERVAGSLVNRLKGGVQPANRSKASMFGDAAPVWSFLDSLGARENPEAARSCASGIFLIEVFPALALPSMIDEISTRGRAAKYNPASRAQFSPDDWRMVAEGVADHAQRRRLPDLELWAREASRKTSPKKANQDQLDAAICVLIAISWRRDEMSELAVLRDGITGYMVTPTSARTRPILASAAQKYDVGFNAVWNGDAARWIDDLSPPAEMSTPLLARITKERGVLGGKPCIRRMRIGVDQVLNMLADGVTAEDILTDFPYLEAEDIRAAYAYGAMLAEKDRLQ